MSLAFASACLLSLILTALVWTSRRYKILETAKGPKLVRKRVQPFEAIPGPWSLPFLGNLLQVAGPPRLHEIYYAWYQKYGRLFRLSLPFVGRIVVLADPDLLLNVYGRPGLPKSPLYQEYNSIFSHKRQDNIFTMLDAGPASNNRIIRKAVAPFFAYANIRENFQVMQQKAMTLVHSLVQTGPDVPLQVEVFMARTTSDILAVAAFGIDLQAVTSQTGADATDLVDLLHYAVGEILAGYGKIVKRPLRALLPWLPYCREYERKHSALYAIWGKMTDRLLAQGSSQEGEFVGLGEALKQLLGTPSQVPGQPFDKSWLQGEVANFMSAGMDTMSQTMSFALLSLAAHPLQQQQVARELDATGLLASSSRAEPRKLTFADLSRLPYLTAVLRETMRLWPAAASGTGRQAPHDIVLGGFCIPKGTTICIPLAILHRLPEYYPEPLSFKPERWLTHCSGGLNTEKGANFELKDINIESGTTPYKPFSFGPRDCPGQRLAQVEMMTVLCTLLGRFEVRLAERMGGWDGCWSRQRCTFTLGIAGGMWLHFKDRRST